MEVSIEKAVVALCLHFLSSPKRTANFMSIIEILLPDASVDKAFFCKIIFS